MGLVGRGRTPFGRGVELGGWILYPATVLYNRHNLFAGTETLILSVYGQSPCTFCGASPFGGGVELVCRVWYPVTVLNITHRLFAGTETLSLSVYEPMAITILLGGPSPNLGEEVELGVESGIS